MIVPCSCGCKRGVYNPSGRGRLIHPDCSARLRKRTAVHQEATREARAVSAGPPRVPDGPPPLPTDGGGRWALIPNRIGHAINDTTGECRTSLSWATVAGRCVMRPVGPWRTLAVNARTKEPRVRFGGARSGAGVPVRELVERTFGKDAPYLHKSPKGVA